jgi:hypothetical protein
MDDLSPGRCQALRRAVAASSVGSPTWRKWGLGCHQASGFSSAQTPCAWGSNKLVLQIWTVLERFQTDPKGRAALKGGMWWV